MKSAREKNVSFSTVTGRSGLNNPKSSSALARARAIVAGREFSRLRNNTSRFLASRLQIKSHLPPRCLLMNISGDPRLSLLLLALRKISLFKITLNILSLCVSLSLRSLESSRDYLIILMGVAVPAKSRMFVKIGLNIAAVPFSR